jgi:hypothetical protein
VSVAVSRSELGLLDVKTVTIAAERWRKPSAYDVRVLDMKLTGQPRWQFGLVGPRQKPEPVYDAAGDRCDFLFVVPGQAAGLGDFHRAFYQPVKDLVRMYTLLHP